MVVVTGTNLNGATAVNFGGTAAGDFTVDSATQITVTVPAGSVGVVDVTVVTPYGISGTSSADQFTYVAAPTVTGVFPDTDDIAGGTPVTITGTNFAGLVAVLFGGTPATTRYSRLSTQPVVGRRGRQRTRPANLTRLVRCDSL